MKIETSDEVVKHLDRMTTIFQEALLGWRRHKIEAAVNEYTAHTGQVQRWIERVGAAKTPNVGGVMFYTNDGIPPDRYALCEECERCNSHCTCHMGTGRFTKMSVCTKCTETR